MKKQNTAKQAKPEPKAPAPAERPKVKPVVVAGMKVPMPVERPKAEPAAYSDGFSNVPLFDRLMRRPPCKCNDGVWYDPNGVKMPEGVNYLVVAKVEFLRGFLVEGEPPQYITELPLPDPAELNDEIPKKLWRKGLNSEPEGPWKFLRGVVLHNEATGEMFLFANHTDGAFRAIEDLEAAVANRRFTTGGNEVPTVQLSSAPWPTRYGMRVRPAFKVVPNEWRTLRKADVPKLLAAPEDEPDPPEDEPNPWDGEPDC
jgi:hypothetical protein